HPPIRLIDRVNHVGGESGAGHPHARTEAVGRRAVRADLAQSRCIVGKDPTVPRSIVPVRAKSNIYDPVLEQKSCAIQMPLCVELEDASRCAIARARDGGGKRDWTAEFFRAARNVESMQPLDISWA